MEKKCKKCNVVKDVSEFSKAKRNRDGLMNGCKLCQKEYYQANKEKLKEKSRQYNEANKERIKEYYQSNKHNIAEKKKEYYQANKEKIFKKFENNKEKIKEKSRQHYEANKEHIAKKNKEYREANKKNIKERKKRHYEANKEKIKQYQKEYTKANREKISISRKEYFQDNKEDKMKYFYQYVKSRKKTDGLFRLKIGVRSAVRRYLKDGKNKRTREIIGIGFKEFQDYLEVEYTEGMHLDHIVPLGWAINDEEVYTLNHYSNFQIITAEENFAKSDSYCKSENLKKVLGNHNDLTKLNQIIERNSDKIK